MELVQLFPNEIIKAADGKLDAIYVVKSGCLEVRSRDNKERYEVFPSMNYGLDAMLNKDNKPVQLIAVRSTSVLKIEISELSDAIEEVDEELQEAFAGLHKAISKHINKAS